MEKSNLAIVIPAYKSEFLGRTLESIANQSSKDFNLYIGDDASPDNLATIIDDYKEKLKISYIRFENNLGSKNLVLHWNRCLEMLSGEEWVWFFSDDDIMEKNCVEQFYFEKQSKKNKYNLYKFNTNIIDANDKIIRSNNHNTKIITSRRFLLNRLLYRSKSYAVEYVFNYRFFMRQGGFVNFPKAWCSDDATWLQTSNKSGIRIIQNGVVYWRLSNFNISGNSEPYKRELLYAAELYLDWLWDKFQYFFPIKFVGKVLLFNWFHYQLLTLGILSSENNYTESFKRFSKMFLIKNKTIFLLTYFLTIFYYRVLFKAKLI